MASTTMQTILNVFSQVGAAISERSSIDDRRLALMHSVALLDRSSNPFLRGVMRKRDANGVDASAYYLRRLADLQGVATNADLDAIESELKALERKGRIQLALATFAAAGVGYAGYRYYKSKRRGVGGLFGVRRRRRRRRRSRK